MFRIQSTSDIAECLTDLFPGTVEMRSQRLFAAIRVARKYCVVDRAMGGIVFSVSFGKPGHA